MSVWYKQAAVSVTNGSALVVGSGADFITVGQINPGDMFSVDNNRFYEVLSVDSDEQITLTENFVGVTQAAIAYAVIRLTISTLSDSALAQQVASLLSSWQTREDQLTTWLGGAAGGGPNLNGTYPLADSLGNTSQVECPAQMQADVDGNVNSALTYSNDAAASANAASTDATNASNSANAASTDAQNALTHYQDFLGVYYGAFAAEPALDPNGNAMGVGDMFWNTTTNALGIYTGAAWTYPETNAQTSATDAANSASAASTSETNASNSANAASTSETNASNSANAASTSETNAANSANAASTSETNAANSASAASTDATNASNSANAASTDAQNALTHYQDFLGVYYGAFAAEPALDPNGNAMGVGDMFWNTTTNALGIYTGAAWTYPETNAQTSATDAANSASAASTSETNASNSANAASTSETNASNSANAASTSETNAATDAANAASSYNSFHNQYYGPLAAAPATRPDSSAMQTGDLYFDTTLSKMQEYNGSAWADLAAASGTVQTGTIVAYTGSTVPTGYLAIPTAATNISRTTYAALFAVIGTTFGAGDGSTTFGMPYLKAGNVFGQAGTLGAYTNGQNLAHTHTVPFGASGTGTTYHGHGFSSLAVNVTSSSSGGSQVLPAGMRVKYMIKY